MADEEEVVPPPLFLTRQITDTEIFEEKLAPTPPLEPEPADLSDMPPAEPVFFKQATLQDAHGNDKQMPDVSKAWVPLTGDQLLSIRRVGAGVPSPNSRFVVSSVKTLSKPGVYHPENNNAFHTHLFLNDLDTGVKKRLTSPLGKNDSSPLWLDDTTVTFLSNRSGSSQIWAINVNGGEAEQLSDFPIGVETFKFNRSQNIFVFSARVYPDVKLHSQLMAQTAERDKANAKLTYKHFTKLYFRHWDVYDDYKRSHVFVHQAYKAVAAGGCGWRLASSFYPQDLMLSQSNDCPLPPFGDKSDYAISPDGEYVAITVHQDDASSKAAWSTNTTLFLFSLSEKVATQLDNVEEKNPSLERFWVKPLGLFTSENNIHKGYDRLPTFSPDGSRIAFFSMEREQFEADLSRIALYDIETKTIRYFTHFLSPDSLIWSVDGKSLFVTADCDGHHGIFKVDLPSDPATTELKFTPIVKHFQNNHVSICGHDKLVYLQSSYNCPPELHICKTDGTLAHPLTSFTTEITRTLLLGHAESFTFKGARDDAIQAWLIKPAALGHSNAVDLQQKYPLVCIIHGGPQGSWTNEWHFRWNPQTLAGQGFAVLCVNFHGSTGFGQPFTDAISKHWSLPTEDILNGVEAALKRYDWLDRNRMAAIGASFGGYMVNWLNGHTDIFKCMITHAGVFDVPAMYFTTEELFFMEFEFGGKPWDPTCDFNSVSPHSFVDKWKTPTLVIHGGKDFRVPNSQGFGAFTALQRLGIDSELLYFPDECHFVVSPPNVVVWHANVLRWLQKYLQN